MVTSVTLTSLIQLNIPSGNGRRLVGINLKFRTMDRSPVLVMLLTMQASKVARRFNRWVWAAVTGAGTLQTCAEDGRCAQRPACDKGGGIKHYACDNADC
jgi:hypothetical protein